MEEITKDMFAPFLGGGQLKLQGRKDTFGWGEIRYVLLNGLCGDTRLVIGLSWMFLRNQGSWGVRRWSPSAVREHSVKTDYRLQAEVGRDGSLIVAVPTLGETLVFLRPGVAPMTTEYVKRVLTSQFRV